MLVATLIGIMIAVVVGVALIPTIIEQSGRITQNVTDTSAMKTLVSALPVIFVAVVLLGAVAWLGGSSRSDREDTASRRSPTDRPFDWMALSRGLKDSYTARFGSRDKTFEKEVDKHIKLVRSSREAAARDIGRTWLKSMTRSMNVPYEVPEESNPPEDSEGKGFE